MPATSPRLSTRELKELIEGINIKIPKTRDGGEYAELLKERQRLQEAYNRESRQRADALADARAKQKLLDYQKQDFERQRRNQNQRDAQEKRRNDRLAANAERNRTRSRATDNGTFTAGRGTVRAEPGNGLSRDFRNEVRNRNQQARQQRGTVTPNAKPQPKPNTPTVNGRGNTGGAQRPLPSPRKPNLPSGTPGQTVRGPFMVPIVDGQDMGTASGALIDALTIDPKSIKGSGPIETIGRTSTRLTRGIIKGISQTVGLSGAIDIIADETGIYKKRPSQQENLLNGLKVSNEQIATQIQAIASQMLNQDADLNAIMRMIQATAKHNDSIMGLLSHLAAISTPIPVIAQIAASNANDIQSIKTKLRAANFTLQNQAATLIKQKLPQLDVAQVMETVRLAEPKLENLNAAQVTKAANLIVQKLPIIDATQLMQTSRLAEKKWNILDATQLMQTSRLAEKKWNILDATQLMKTSRLAEIKWGILDATQLMQSARTIPTILQTLQKPLQLPADIARKADINNIKFPALPSDLARKSDVKVTVTPTPVTVRPVVNPTPVTVNPTPVTVTPTPVNLAPVVSQIASLGQSLNQTITNQTTNITNIVNNAPKADLSPVLNAIAPISTVLGVPSLLGGLTFNPNNTFTDLARKSSNGGSNLTVPNLPQLIMAVAAIPYARQGLQRLGGRFDKSLLDPSKGQTTITDTLAFQKWSFDQIDERLGMPTTHTILTPGGQTESKTFRSLEDAIEENNANTIVAIQDLEVVERYIFALTQDVQKLMQIILQCRADIDVLVDDAGCKVKEIKKSHPTHLNLPAKGEDSSLTKIFQGGQVHYVARQWADSADKNQKLERMGYDTQIAAMSNKYELDKNAVELPLDKSKAVTRPNNDNEVWKTFVSTVTEPPEGYVSAGNPIPKIETIENGTAKPVPKPTNPNKKLGQ